MKFKNLIFNRKS